MRRRPARLIMVGASLLALGGALLLAGALAAGDPVPRAAWEATVNPGAGDLSDISAHNSPTLARHPHDPARLAAGSRIDTPRFSCAVHVSIDGGRRWRALAVPIPEGEERKCYAADVAYDAEGTLLVSYVTLRGVGNVPNGVWVSRSSDGGRTLSRPVKVAGPLAFQVRIAADPRRAGRLHATWLQAREVGSLRFTGPGNPIVTSRSDDGGATWRDPVRVSPPDRGRVLAPTPQVGSGGELYVLYLDVGDDRLDYQGGHEGYGGPAYRGDFSLVLARSADGTRWEDSVVDDEIRAVERFVAFIPPFPSLALDRGSGRIHAAFHDARGGDADAVLWTLEPGAAAWRGPTQINDTPRGDRSSQRLPQLSVAPGGRLDAAYLDRRGDPRDVRTEVSLQSSFDGGRTFGPRAVLSERPFDSRIGFGSERDMPDQGSRVALSSDREGALAVWADSRHGTDASNKLDLVAGMAVLEGGGAAEALRDGGLALLAGGLMALALALAAGRRRRAATH